MADSGEHAEVETGGKSGGGVVGLVILAMGSLAAAFATVYLLTPSAQSATLAECPAGPGQPIPASPLVEKDRAYVEMDEFLVTIGSEPATRYLKLTVSIVTSNSEVNFVKQSQPVLTDAFVNYLRSVELSDFENPAFYAEMRAQLARRAELVLGGSVTDGVLITEFLLR